MFNLIKILHVLGASLLFGGIIANFLWISVMRSSKWIDHFHIKSATPIFLALIFIGLLLQPASGFTLLLLRAAQFPAPWIIQIITTYGVVLLSSLVILYSQLKLLSLTSLPHGKIWYKTWRITHIPLTISLLLLYFWMTDLHYSGIS